MDLDAQVAVGKAALAEGRFDDAAAAFSGLLALGEHPEALDGLADVRYRQGDYASAVALHERAYAAFRSRGEIRSAAALAGYMLAFEYAAVFGDLAVANGWLERGKRLVEEAGDCAERGWVELACVPATDDLTERERHIAAAMEIARRFGDADLEFDALAYAGATLVERGRIAEGMRRLDEAAAAARGGEVARHFAAGEIYCQMMLACEMTLDVRRAEQWLDVAGRMADRSDAWWISAICRMHYGGILTAAGRWTEADDELRASVRLYDTTYRALRSSAVVRLADLRVRQGRLEEAERLLAGQEQDPYAVRPLARLHLRKDEPDVAATLLRRHLGRYGENVPTVPVLALLADVELAAGRPDRAHATAARLTALAEQAPARSYRRSPAMRPVARRRTGPRRCGGSRRRWPRSKRQACRSRRP